jgi:hypothetical protein
MPLLDLLIPHFEGAQHSASESQAQEAEPQAASESSDSDDSGKVKRRRQTAAARMKRWQNQCAARLRKEIVPQPKESEDEFKTVMFELAQFLTPSWKTKLESEPMKRRRQQNRALWSYLKLVRIRITHSMTLFVT